MQEFDHCICPPSGSRSTGWGATLGSPCAARPQANAATAHKLARMVYFMLTRGDADVDQGQRRYEEQQHERSINALKRRASVLGFEVSPMAATT